MKLFCTYPSRERSHVPPNGKRRVIDSKVFRKNSNTGTHTMPSMHVWHIFRVFPTIGVLQNGWFIMENPIKMHDLRVLFFFETPKCRYACYLHVSSQVAWLLIHVTRKAVGFFVRAKVWWARHLPTNSRSRGRWRMIEADAKRLVIHPGRWTAGTYKSPI